MRLLFFFVVKSLLKAWAWHLTRSMSSMVGRPQKIVRHVAFERSHLLCISNLDINTYCFDNTKNRVKMIIFCYRVRRERGRADKDPCF